MENPVREIDLVYTWVDGSEPDFRDKLEYWRRNYAAENGNIEPEAVAVRRFRDLDNLRYSLRSVEQNIPWFRKIFLVTHGQAPRWLAANPRIEVISHDKIIAAQEFLPLFNAHPVEWGFFRIPGLARNFIYFNDDMFVVRPTDAQFFFGSNGLPKLFFNQTELMSLEGNRELWARLYVHQAKLLTGRFGLRRWRAALHGPVLIDGQKLAEVYEIWREAIELSLQNRFRELTDVHMHTVYMNTMAALDEQQDDSRRHQQEFPGLEDFRAVSIGHHSQPNWQSALREIRVNPPRLLCLNDDFPDDEAGFSQCALAHRQTLDALFPKRSSFER